MTQLMRLALIRCYDNRKSIAMPIYFRTWYAKLTGFKCNESTIGAAPLYGMAAS